MRRISSATLVRRPMNSWRQMKILRNIPRWGNPVSKCSMKRFCAAATDGSFILRTKGQPQTGPVRGRKDGRTEYRAFIDSKTQERAYTLMASNLVDGQSGAGDRDGLLNGGCGGYGFRIRRLITTCLISRSTGPWNYYNGDEDHPLINRAIQSGVYAGLLVRPFSSCPPSKAACSTRIPFRRSPRNRRIPRGMKRAAPTAGRRILKAGIRGDLFKTVAESPYNYEMAMKSSDNIFFAYYAFAGGG